MTNLQASMKDRSARNWRRDKLMRKVSSCFKGCAHCGEWEMRESRTTGKEYKHWFLPGEVWQSYEPIAMGWTHWCYECGAKDAQCWTPPEFSLREKEVKFDGKAQIVELEKRLAELTEMLKGVKA